MIEMTPAWRAADAIGSTGLSTPVEDSWCAHTTVAGRGSCWKLVQVLRHEINNSLAPIKSIAESLRRQMRREPLAVD